MKNKLVSVVMAVAMAVGPLAYAEEAAQEKVAGGSTLAGVVLSTALVGPVSSVAMVSSGIGMVGSAILAGSYLEWKTDPRRRGLYRYNHQTDATGENRKWERDQNGNGMRLKGYKTDGSEVSVKEADNSYPKKWMRSENGLMIKMA